MTQSHQFFNLFDLNGLKDPHIGSQDKNEDLHLSDLSAFVVTTKDCNSVGEADLEGNKERHSLHTVVATIYVVTHEEVVGVGRLTTNLKELAQVVELSVDITADSDRSANLLHV